MKERIENLFNEMLDLDFIIYFFLAFMIIPLIPVLAYIWIIATLFKKHE